MAMKSRAKKPPATTAGVYRCIDGFAILSARGPVMVPAGALVPYDFGYEVMRGRESHFVDVSHPRGGAVAPVEQATAAPGEVREVVPPPAPENDDAG